MERGNYMTVEVVLRHSDVATCHANRVAISAPERLRRLTGCSGCRKTL